ncbi:MAG: acetyltransferase [Pseudomonadota bacterium]|nr:acetyltransferase [Pseudomonadota bacterium]
MKTRFDLYILCAGGHTSVLMDILSKSSEKVKGILDDNKDLFGKSVGDTSIIGSLEDILSLDKNKLLLINGLGNIPSIKNSDLNKRGMIFTNYKKLGYTFKTIISPDAIISDRTEIQEGAQVISSAVINAGVIIGKNSIINTSATIDHNCKIGFNTHIAPGAVICGGVVIGDSCHIGAGSILVPGVKISNGVVIGAGAVVLNDVSENETVVGNPAKII